MKDRSLRLPLSLLFVGATVVALSAVHWAKAEPQASTTSGVLTYFSSPATKETRVTLESLGDRIVIVDDFTHKIQASGRAGEIKRIVIRGVDGDHNDTLTVDFSGGLSLPGGIDFDGGIAGFDTLRIVGDDVANTHYIATNNSDGVVKIGATEIRYRNLEPITNTGTVTNITFSLPSGTVGAILQDNGSGSPQLASTNGTFESTTFSSPTNSLTIDDGGGADTLSVTAGARAELTVPVSLVVNVAGTSSPTLSVTDSSGILSGSWSFGNRGTVTFSGIQELNPADVSVSNSAPATVPAGANLTYTIGVSNGGSNAAGNIVLSDPLPPGTTFTSESQTSGPAFLCTPPAVGTGGTVSCSIATLASGASATFQVVVGTGLVPASITGTATVSSDTTDTNLANNTSSATTASFLPPTIVASFAPGTIEVAGTSSLSFTITNPNAGVLTGVGFNDTLPTGLAVSSPNGLVGVCGGGTITAVSGSGSISLTGAILVSGSFCTFSIDVTATAAASSFSNTTSAVTSNEGGAGNTASAMLTVICPSVVTSLSDSGPGSLRVNIGCAASGASITFAVAGTITLASTLTIGTNLTITGPGAASLAISGNNAVQVLHVTSGSTVSISGVTIEEGASSSANGIGVQNDGTLTLNSSIISGNNITASGSGAGIYNTGTLILSSSTVSANSINVGGSGGGLDSVSGVVMITNSTISGNSAGLGGGGGIYISSGTITITNSTISDNHATAGGGINNVSGTTTITSSTISGNSAGAADGGGIHNGATLNLNSSTISGNTALVGGGINNVSGTTTIINSTFSGNSANASGGGLNVAAGTLNLSLTTISGNGVTGGPGGGIFWNGTGAVNVVNMIIAGNTSAIGPDAYNMSGAFTDNGNNLIGVSGAGSGNTGFLAATTQTGTVATPLDPKLAPLGNYGGQTQTMLPMVGSPAIDNGSNTGAPAADQRGFTRIVNGTIDIGAVEFQGVALAATGGTTQSATVVQAFAAPLQVTATENVSNVPLASVSITYTDPSIGPTASLGSGGLATTAVNGQASVTATANLVSGGPYTVTATATPGGATATFMLTNIAASQSIMFNAFSSAVTYGVAPIMLSATASSNLAVAFAVTSGPCFIPSGTTLMVTGAGTCVIQASQLGNATYAAAMPVSENLTVDKAALAVTANNQTVTYGALPTYTVSFTGLVNGDTSSVVSGSATFSTNATTTNGNPNAGNWTITPGAGTLTASNYTFGTFNVGTLTVNKVGLTVTANNQTVAYGAAFPTFAATITGFVNGDTVAVVTGAASFSNNATTTNGKPNVGSWTITPAAGTLSASNYTFATFNAGTLTVSQPVLTVTAISVTIVSGSPLPVFTYTITGFVNGDTSSVVTGAPRLVTTVTSTAAPGTYPINASAGTLAAANYSFTFVNGALTVLGAPPAIAPTPAPPTISLSGPLVFNVPLGTTTSQQTLQITNGGSGTLIWTLTVSYTNGSNWLALSQSSGMTGANSTTFVSVTVNTSGLPVGTYSATITVSSSNAANPLQTFTVTVVVTASSPPTIGSFTPTSGPVGSVVTITGTNFTGATTVTFNGVQSTGFAATQTSSSPMATQGFRAVSAVMKRILPASFTVVSDTTITATVPAGATAGPIAVTTPSGTTTSTSNFVVMPLQPVVFVDGIVNNASFAPGTNPLAPGTIAAIFGTDLDDGSNNPSASLASNGQLPTTLGGASVTFNGVPAPLFAAFPGQLVVEIPQEMAGAASATVEVTVAGQTSPPVTVPLGPFSPGLFSVNSQGTGQGAILIANTANFAAPDGSIPGAQVQPVSPGAFISIYATGLGAVSNSLATGQLASANPLSNTTATPQVTIGGIPANVSFSGLAPGAVGLYQINAQVPSGTPTGSDVPVMLSIGEVNSNIVTIAIQ